MDNNKDELCIGLRDDFFDNETIIALEKLPNGYSYLNILFQMYLISQRSEGKIENNAINISCMLEDMLEESIENVESAIAVFIDYGIIKIMADGVIDMMPDDSKLREIVWLKTKDSIG